MTEFRSPPSDVRSSAGSCRIARGLGRHTVSATQIRLRGRGHAVAGGRVTDRSGSGYRYGSIWTRLSWPVQPWLRVEDGRSAVSTFGLPWRQKRRIRRIRVVPGAGGQLDDTRTHCVGDDEPGEAAAAVVERPARRRRRACRARRRRPGACRIGSRPATFADGCARRSRAGCAAGCAAGWRSAAAGTARRSAAEPFVGLEPGRMARAVGVAEAGDGLGEDLDPPARRAAAGDGPDRRGSRRTATCRRLGHGSSSPSPRPELVEVRHVEARGLQRRAPAARTGAAATPAAVRPSVKPSPTPSRSASSAKIA